MAQVPLVAAGLGASAAVLFRAILAADEAPPRERVAADMVADASIDATAVLD